LLRGNPIILTEEQIKETQGLYDNIYGQK